jgi:hypothetical protein
MNLRPALLATATLATAFCTTLAVCRWGGGGNEELSDLAWVVQHGEELGPSLEAGRRRHEAKWALAAEVAAGRMTVREAAGHFRRLDEAASDFPAGIPRPPGDESALRANVLDYVWVVLGDQQRYATAARWYDAAFTAYPQLLSDPPPGHRYYAACAAALAGCGQGRDAADLDEKSRVGFHRQARVWLRADLEARRQLLEKEPAKALTVARDMRYWLRDSSLSRVREPEALARLPEAERQAWQKLWADVADTRARAEGTTPLEQRADSKALLPER